MSKNNNSKNTTNNFLLNIIDIINNQYNEYNNSYKSLEKNRDDQINNLNSKNINKIYSRIKLMSPDFKIKILNFYKLDNNNNIFYNDDDTIFNNEKTKKKYDKIKKNILENKNKIFKNEDKIIRLIGKVENKNFNPFDIKELDFFYKLTTDDNLLKDLIKIKEEINIKFFSEINKIKEKYNDLMNEIMKRLKQYINEGFERHGFSEADKINILKNIKNIKKNIKIKNYIDGNLKRIDFF